MSYEETLCANSQVRSLAAAVETACMTISDTCLTALQDSLSQACGIPAKSDWERKAAAHANFFKMLAEATNDQGAAQALRSGARLEYDLLITVGHSADFIVANSRNRVLTHIRAGKARDAAAEMEKNLGVLRFMERLFMRHMTRH
jgi:DNA-binding GntR family transcriptional regulator